MGLASRADQMKWSYDVVVVGSGYGGSIAASRLARAGLKVCLLERGREFRPGNYPNTRSSIQSNVQIDLPHLHIGPRSGLYDFRVNRELNVFQGCGLGGGSLVNASVALRAERWVLEDPVWPAEFRDDIDGRLEEGFRLAWEMLKPSSYPEGRNLRKLAALERASRALTGRFYRPPLNVTFEPLSGGTNHVGVAQEPCSDCGDCVTGCNYSAKNTLLMNYLPDAWNHGAEIFTEIEVRRIERRDGRWLTHFSSPDGLPEGTKPVVAADLVVLGAGALGSTEILLRSRDAGLPVSDRLGEGFFGNADILGFAYNCDVPVNGTGYGHHPASGREPVGPSITGIIDGRSSDRRENGIVIEEGAFPGGVSSYLVAALGAAAAVLGRDTDRGLFDLLREKVRKLTSVVRGPYHGAIRHTLTYLCMGHDENSGRMELDDDRLRISWPGAGKQPIVEAINRALLDATKQLGGKFVRNPMWTELLGHDLMTVHPLGGCGMARDGDAGVVNHRGQVFEGAGDEVYEGLYVCDAAVMPRSIGVNPLLTISAVAERCCTLIAEDRGLRISYSLPSSPSDRPA